MRRSTRRQQAFSLLEMLVVLAVGSVIIGICIGMSIQANRMWVTQQARISASRAGWRTVNRIARDLRMAMAPGAGGAFGKLEGRDGSKSMASVLPEGVRNALKPESYESVKVDDDTLVLPAAHVHDRDDAYRPGVVSYALKYDEAGCAVGILQRTATLGKSLQGDDAQETVISDQIVSLDFKYLDASGTWQAAWQRGDTMPRAIRVTVGALPKRPTGRLGFERFTTTVSLAGGTRIPR